MRNPSSLSTTASASSVSSKNQYHWSVSGGEKSIFDEDWFLWVIVGCAALFLIILTVIIIWCCRTQCHNKSSKQSKQGNVQLVWFPFFSGGRAPTQTTGVQPMVPLDDYLRNQQTHNIALINPQIPGSTRSRQKGLLESRRGSHTSLTLSLSPSLDSVSTMPERVPSPNREISDRDCLLQSRLLLTREELREKLSNDSAALFTEFWEIPMNHSNKKEIPLRSIGTKNRYQSIIPNEKTRVILPCMNNDPLSTYINANYIQGYKGREKSFIATQGPMSHTIVDFWRMVWHTHAPIIVMVTDLIEKSKRKCELYLPDNKSSETYGPIKVTSLSYEEKDGYSVRHFQIQCDRETRHLMHLWYPSWPDHATPDTRRQILRLVGACESYLERRHTFPPESPSSDPKGPIIVHCSAGLGRTGCFIGLCIGCQQLREEGAVDVLGIVSRMRLDRGGMVQTSEQYEFIHQTLASEELERHQTGLEDYSPL